MTHDIRREDILHSSRSPVCSPIVRCYQLFSDEDAGKVMWFMCVSPSHTLTHTVTHSHTDPSSHRVTHTHTDRHIVTHTHTHTQAIRHSIYLYFAKKKLKKTLRMMTHISSRHLLSFIVGTGITKKNGGKFGSADFQVNYLILNH